MSSRPSRGTARLAAILDALPDGLLLVNCNGTVVNANAIALEMFETPGAALVGRGLLDLLPEFDSRLIPGSMRRPETTDEHGRTKPARMTARRTDRHEYPVEVTSASLDSGQAAYNDIHSSYTGDELLMIVVRDLSGTVDTEAELARSQRQTEMILRAASEGVVGTDTDGRVVLVNPAAAQILGFRASDLGGQELHPLILHSRAEGEPFPYEESPLADTLKSGRKHRVRGQVLWSKSGARVPVDLTTAPVRDGDQLVGAVMTFTDRRPYEELSAQHKSVVAELTASHDAEVTALKEAHTAELEALKEAHTAELADRSERYAAEIEGQAELLASLGAQHAQLTAVLGGSLRGPLEELRGELSALASDPAGQLWPEANQILHHLAAGYARMTTLVDNVLGFQRLDAGVEGLHKAPALVEGIVKGGIDGAVELIGPGRAQFAVHAPPIEAEVDARQLATAIAHLVADVCGVDATGKARAVPGGGYVDTTVVVAAAQRGDAVRIEVRGPYAGGDPVHEPLVRGIVRAHGGVLQTHEMPGMSGSAYVLDVPIGAASGTIAPPVADGAGPAPEPAAAPAASSPSEGVGAPGVTSGGRRRARRSSTDAFLDGPGGTAESIGDDATGAVPASPDDRPDAEPTGRRRARRGPAASEEQAPELIPAQQGEGSGRRRGRPSPAEAAPAPGTAAEGPAAAAPEQREAQPRRSALALAPAPSASSGPSAHPGSAGPSASTEPSSSAGPSGGAAVTGAENVRSTGRPELGPPVPPQGPRPIPSRPCRPRESRPALSSPCRPGESPPAPSSPFPHRGSRWPRSTRSSPCRPPGAGRVGRARTWPSPPSRPAAAAPPRTGRVRNRPRPALSSPGAGGPGAPWPPPRSARPPTPVRGPPSPCRRPTPTAPRARPTPRRAPTTGRARTTRAPHRRPATPRPRRTPSPRRTSPRSRTAPRPRALPPTGPPAMARPPRLTPSAHRRSPGHRPPPPSRPAPANRRPRARLRTTPRGATTPRAPVPAPSTAPVPASARPRTPPGPRPSPNRRGTRPTVTQAPRARGGSRCRPRSRCRRACTPTRRRGGRSACGRSARACRSPSTSHTSRTSRTRASAGPADDASSPPRRRTTAPRPGPAAASRRRTSGPASADRPRTRGPSLSSPARGRNSRAAPPRPPPARHRAEPGPARSGQGAGTVPRAGADRPGSPGPESGPARSARPARSERRHRHRHGLRRGAAHRGARRGGRAYAIGAPDEGAEGPEPLDGPGGAVEVANRPHPQPMDDELPPEPLDNPRRLLVWPAPDVPTQQALSDRGYRPVIVNSREEVDAQIAAFPAALFVDPLTGPSPVPRCSRCARRRWRPRFRCWSPPVWGRRPGKRRTGPTRPSSSRRWPRATANSTLRASS